MYSPRYHVNVVFRRSFLVQCLDRQCLFVDKCLPMTRITSLKGNLDCSHSIEIGFRLFLRELLKRESCLSILTTRKKGEKTNWSGKDHPTHLLLRQLSTLKITSSSPGTNLVETSEVDVH